MCPSCWALNAQTAAAPTGQLQTAGLIFGVLSIIPCCPLMLASLVVNLIAILKATKENRWKPLTGISITIGVGLLELAFVFFYSMFSKPR